MMGTALTGVSSENVEQIVTQLAVIKENLRQAIQQRTPIAAGEQRYG